MFSVQVKLSLVENCFSCVCENIIFGTRTGKETHTIISYISPVTQAGTKYQMKLIDYCLSDGPHGFTFVSDDDIAEYVFKLL